MKLMKSSARPVALVSGLCLLVALAVSLLDPDKMVGNLREDVFDRLLIWLPQSPVVPAKVRQAIGIDDERALVIVSEHNIDE